MSNGNKISPFYGILIWIIVGAFFYLLCSLFSWSFHIDEWNLFSRIIKWIGFIVEAMILGEVIRQIVTGDRFDQ